MVFYVIDRARLFRELEANRMRGKGVVNWLVRDGRLHVLYELDNVKYIYFTDMKGAEKDSALTTTLWERGKGPILGAVGDEELFKELDDYKKERADKDKALEVIEDNSLVSEIGD